MAGSFALLPRRLGWLLMMIATVSPRGTDFFVENTLDTGPGTLRAAIQAANLHAGEDAILFRLSGPAPHVIEVLSPLPPITDPVRIEAAYTNFEDPRQVELNGQRAGPNANGLHLAVGDCVVRGLAIGGFDAHGILMEFFGQHVIQGNFLGTDARGNPRLNGEAGVAIFESSRNKVGGTTPAEGNLISGNITGVFVSGTSAYGNVVQGNLIGPDLTGRDTVGNSQNGVLIYDAPLNVVGGTVAGARNVISANAQSGVYLYGSEAVSNRVSGNFIGLDVSGTNRLANGENGVTVYNALNNVIGGEEAGAGNVISGNGKRGVFITGETSFGNVVAGNLVGTDVTGLAAAGNGFNGVAIENVGTNRVGGTTKEARNVISGNLQSGVLLRGTTTRQNVILGNYIGTDINGLISIQNSYNGITLEGAAGNIIGGVTEGGGNLISGNREAGVFISEPGATGNRLEGNIIGLDATGKAVLTNGYAGVRLEFGGNEIGRPGGRPNVITGNGHAGVEIFGDVSGTNRIQGNLIGTDIEGKIGLGNSGGIAVSGSTDNLIGGTTVGAGNVISGNDDSGIFLVGADTMQNVIQGNWIGTDRAGQVAIPNNGDGISVFGAPGSLIGGTNVLAGNIISANLQNGIYLIGAGASNNILQRNFIGTAGDGTNALGNRLHGIELDEEASGNVIGGGIAAANRIAYSQTADFDGVRVHSGTRNNIRGNAIFGNRGLGIDIGEDGVTPNDAGDGDSGANGLVNYPVITAAFGGTSTEIRGTLNSTPSRTFVIDFYVNSVADESGYGEAEAWLGALEVRTGVSGEIPFEAVFPTAVALGKVISAMATDGEGNSSELSLAARVGERDTDGDGMPDAFETAHGLNLADPKDASADRDGDGLTNLQEYWAGTNPADAQSTLRLEARLNERQEAALTFGTTAGRQYRIEYTDKLPGAWRPLRDQLGDGTPVTLTDGAAAARQRLYRVVLLR